MATRKLFHSLVSPRKLGYPRQKLMKHVEKEEREGKETEKGNCDFRSVHLVFWYVLNRMKYAKLFDTLRVCINYRNVHSAKWSKNYIIFIDL